MYDFKNIDEDGFTFGDLMLSLLSSAVRLFGFVLMLFGLWVAVMVMWEALELYEDPKRIEQLAQHIEQGSNVDSSLSSVSSKLTSKASDANTQIEKRRNNKNNDIRVSYFFAWAIAILLLLLIARIALGAIKTGGELVLYDVQIKRFAKELAKESMRIQK